MRQLYIDGSRVAQMLVKIREDRESSNVVVVGSMNADHTVEVENMPKPGETIIGGPMIIHSGGKSANQASTCARLGERTHMLGAVGSDANGAMLVRELVQAGVEVSDIEHVDGVSGSTVIVVDVHGENFVVVSPGSNSSVTTDYIIRHQNTIESASVLGLCLESPLESVIASAKIASSAAATVVLNISPMPSSDKLEALHNLCRYVDVAIMNEYETAQFLGLPKAIRFDSDWNDIRRRLLDRGLRHVIVTLGAAGSVVLGTDMAGDSLLQKVQNADDNTIVHIPALRVTPMDTTGAGDAFMGSVLHGLAHGANLIDAALMASVVSAYATLGKGAQSSYGNTEQIIGFLRKRGNATM